jgi:FKBP-type peptidyl-prolyl cis-trans isomerase
VHGREVKKRGEVLTKQLHTDTLPAAANSGREGAMMRQVLMCMACLALLVTPAVPAEKQEELKTQKDKVSYMLGVDMGKKMKSELEKQSIDVDPAVLAKGIKDALAGGTMLLSEAELQEIRTALQNDITEKNKQRVKALAEKNKKEGDAFLAENRKKDGVKTTDSGLQYKVITAGTGSSPRATDIVTVNYRGTLVDGSEFDSSYKRGEPVSFLLNQVIKGWNEGIQLMKEGGKFLFVIPSELAYGERGTPGGPIGPGAVLIFEVELLSVGDKGPGLVQPGRGVIGK